MGKVLVMLLMRSLQQESNRICIYDVFLSINKDKVGEGWKAKMREENCGDVFCSLIIGRWSGGIRVVAVGDCIRFALWWRITIGRFISIRKRKRWRSCSKVYRLISDNKDIASRVKCRSSITFLIYIYRGCACCVMFFFCFFPFSLFLPPFFDFQRLNKRKNQSELVSFRSVCVLSCLYPFQWIYRIIFYDPTWNGKRERRKLGGSVGGGATW